MLVNLIIHTWTRTRTQTQIGRGRLEIVQTFVSLMNGINDWNHRYHSPRYVCECTCAFTTALKRAIEMYEMRFSDFESKKTSPRIIRKPMNIAYCIASGITRHCIIQFEKKNMETKTEHLNAIEFQVNLFVLFKYLNWAELSWVHLLASLIMNPNAIECGLVLCVWRIWIWVFAYVGI